MPRSLTLKDPDIRWGEALLPDVILHIVGVNGICVDSHMVILGDIMYKQNVGGSHMVKTENFTLEILLHISNVVAYWALGLAYSHKNK